MPQKHLILIHGRAIKPAEKPMKRLALDALKEGLRRAGKDELAERLGKSGDNGIKYSFAYYGDENNRIQAEEDQGDADLLTDTDPDTGKKVFPIDWLRKDFDVTRQIPKFGLPAYRKVLEEAEDSRFLDEIADIGSFFGSLFSAGIVNTLTIRHAKPDMGAYLQTHATGSLIRERLGRHLTPALKRGDDICIIAHSMGSMVAYDQLWKSCMQSEYSDVCDRKVSLFLTIGSPLGEHGVRRNLLDARYSRDEQYPRNIRDWRNLYARDDYIAHVEKLGTAYREMKRDGHVNSIKDKEIHNCWTYEDIKSGKRVSNPHDLYGYLMHQETGKLIGDWVG